MDRFGHSATTLDELRQIRDEARRSNSLTELRSYFDRVQELRRIHADDFDVQLIVAEAHDEIIEHARELRSRPGTPHPADFRPPEEPIAEPEELPVLNKSWRRATYAGLALIAVIGIVFVYLVQTARRINLSPTAVNTVTPAGQGAKTPLTPVASTEAPGAPTVRLYTDLIPGTVSVDDGDPQDLKDGELVLDHLESGRHSIRVSGRSGSAEFSFDVSDKAAPQIVPPIIANNAMAVAVSSQDGKGRVLSNVSQLDISVDGKPAGQAGPDGLALDDLGAADHELQAAQANDRQRFVLTYTRAPALTVFVKSDLNAGFVTINTRQDDATILIDDKPYRRKTEHGLIRLPVKVGAHLIRVHKDGFVDPPPQSVNLVKGQEVELTFDLEPVKNLASLQVHGAAPGTAILLDNVQVGIANALGEAAVKDINAGEHQVQLKLDGSVPKKFERNFPPGGPVTIAGADAVLDKVVAESKPAQPAAPEAEQVKAPVAAPPMDIPGEQVRRGGGFVHYNTPRAAGRYSFEAHGKIGGFLKHAKLQWYAGYLNSENYVMFSLDGKHATVREMKDGKGTEISRIPFDANSDQWIQVDMAVKPGSISTRIKTPGSDWEDLGAVTSDGRDFTQDKVGFYIPGNDEVAVAHFHFAGHPDESFRISSWTSAHFIVKPRRSNPRL